MNSLVSITNEQDLFEIDEAKINDICKNMLDFALKNIDIKDEIKGISSINFDVVFCDNETIKEINYEYRGKDKPTDVITFSLFFDDENRIIIDNTINLGEIIISTQKIDIQAKEHNKAFNEELLFIIAHGILHLLGLDHPDDKSLKSMIEMQEKMIEEVIDDKV